MKWFNNQVLDIKPLSGEELAGEISDNMYSMPKNESIFDYPEFVQTAYFLIDFDTELGMDGIFGILHNSIFENIPEIIKSFERIGDKKEAELLSEIVNYADNIGLNEKKIGELGDGFYLYTGFDMWSLLFNYLDKEIENYNG